jgi:hypothetical protein
VAILAVACVLLAGSRAGAVGASTLTQVYIPYEITGDYCGHGELFYWGHPGADNLTVIGVDGIDSPVVPAEGPVCWRTAGNVFFVDHTTAISTNRQEGCVTSAGARAAHCSQFYFDLLRIDAGDGHDSIRVGPSQVRRVEIFGGDGPDAIRTVNRHYEFISCGPGVDSVIADRGDDIDGDCENVQLEL